MRQFFIKSRKGTHIKRNQVLRKLFSIFNIHIMVNPCRNSELPRKKGEILYIGSRFTEASFLSKDVTMSSGSKSSRAVVTFTAKDIDVSDLLSTSMVGLDGRSCICCILAYICNMGYSRSSGALLLFCIWLHFLGALLEKMRSEELVLALS